MEDSEAAILKTLLAKPLPDPMLCFKAGMQHRAGSRWRQTGASQQLVEPVENMVSMWLFLRS